MADGASEDLLTLERGRALLDLAGFSSRPPSPLAPAHEFFFLIELSPPTTLRTGVAVVVRISHRGRYLSWHIYGELWVEGQQAAVVKLIDAPPYEYCRSSAAMMAAIPKAVIAAQALRGTLTRMQRGNDDV